MPKIVATHDVVDVERWLSGKARAAAIESGSNVTDFVAEDGSNKIAVTADVAALTEKHGVVRPITLYVEAWPADSRPVTSPTRDAGVSSGACASVASMKGTRRG